MKRLVLCVLALAACDPVYGVNVRLKDPSKQPIENATLAIACLDGQEHFGRHAAARSEPTGEARVGGLGSQFPVGCDIYVAKPGFHTHRIRYREICPKGPDGCNRVFQFDLVLQPE